jgi:uncharacterized protein (DUF924 family)
MKEEIEAIHSFWFGPLDDAGLTATDRNALWFGATAATDAACRERFGGLVESALAGDLDEWAGGDRGLVALLLLLDQFPRNIFRASARAFSGDARALDLAQETIAGGHHQRLPAIHQAFLFLPLEHHEDLEVQEECVTLFEELAAVTGSDLIAGFTRYAVAHRDVIARFGRFPHRNAVLGRESTAAELAWLAQRGGF